ncbi:hypothetical protein [Spiroplasma cantharicola]|uniref:Uncharacterized protein n=1 Tax=Spiroplasma cantharicola TaxID=362837 RepID=A0A0M4KEL5_9MOLU|nr:hypothetical protein [Spiroplasma cantharicola]ALD66457.1 hypothetical protein SCANT_v1c05510 [Spiroplasma cantharicola]
MRNQKNSINLLKKHNKIIRKFFKTNLMSLFAFIFDQTIFSITLVLFITNLFIKESNDIVSYLIVGGSIYLLLKFTYINWFSKSKFFQLICIFDYNLKLENHKFKAQRSLEFTPIWFWIYIIFSNFITVIFINYELSSILSDKPLLTAILESMLNVMLLPSFLNSFQKLTQSNKEVESNYKNLIKTQYFSNESLFKDAKFSENYLNVVFKKNDLVSKNGLFIFSNNKDLTNNEILEIKKINDKILDNYTKIWSNYYELLEESSMLEFSRKKAKNLFWIERVYDHIFLDFLNI